MAVFFNKVMRGNPRDLTAPKKWYAVLRAVGQKGEKDVAKLLADETTLNPKEAEMALAQFQKILLRLLLDGYAVQLGDWGSFYLTCSSEGSDTEKEVSATNIKNLNIRFHVGKELKDGLKYVKLVPVESMIK